MKIEEKINESIKDSMKKKDNVRLDSLRAIKSAILIESKRTKNIELGYEKIFENYKNNQPLKNFEI